MQRREGVKEEALRWSLDRMNSSDPSEGIRASEIVPLTASRFEVRHFSYVGGTLLFLIFNEIAGNFEEKDPEIMPLVNALIALDNFLIDNQGPAVLSRLHGLREDGQSNANADAQICFRQPLRYSRQMTWRHSLLNHSRQGLITAEPKPFRTDSEGLGQTTLSWLTHGTSKVEVRVNAPDGLLFARLGPGRHSQSTGQWVRDGTTFYLQNVSKGLPLAAENTIATVTLKSM